jgi:hypothetical protein
MDAEDACQGTVAQAAPGRELTCMAACMAPLIRMQKTLLISVLQNPG